MFVALMTAAAYIEIPFPLMPLTFQTAVAVTAGLLLGARKGAAAMSVYCIIGLMGLPVFTAGGGIFYVMKPSFGYILGFIASAATGGAIVRSGATLRRFIFAAVAAFLADYVIGIPYCIIAAKSLGVSDLWGLFLTGHLVFMPKDLILCIMAAFIARAVRPALLRLHGEARKQQ